MTQCNTLNGKLSNSQIKELISGIKKYWSNFENLILMMRIIFYLIYY